MRRSHLRSVVGVAPALSLSSAAQADIAPATRLGLAQHRVQQNRQRLRVQSAIARAVTAANGRARGTTHAPLAASGGRRQPFLLVRMARTRRFQREARRELTHF